MLMLKRRGLPVLAGRSISNTPRANYPRTGNGSAPGKKSVMFMNRFTLFISTLYIANTDGSNERHFFLETALPIIIMEISHRMKEVKVDGAELESLVETPSSEDVLSPDEESLLMYPLKETGRQIFGSRISKQEVL
ncbi:hypothetical protein OCU04_010529 [Sclerotinia nivalis]|uniref:Uncharacterized protein n=1 Tax=Sclerotinia nivalis TaxID=352851 RepID=A0A9X0DGS4_9HELO|nr:hypothetical protein OCU04_010529 [Sclerotinia nivalis]